MEKTYLSRLSIEKNRHLIKILNIIFVISSGCFTFGIAITNEKWEVLISIIITIAFFSYFSFKKKLLINIYYNIKIGEILLALYFGIRFAHEFSKKTFSIIQELTFFYDKIIIVKYFIVFGSLIFLFTCFLLFFKKVNIAIHNFFNEMDKMEKIYFVSSTFICTFIICLVYSLTNGFSQQYDVVYSIDAGYVTNKIFPKLYYFDIRHTLLSIIMFPIWRVCRDIEIILGCKAGLSIILLSVFNSQLLIIIGILLKRLTKSNWILLMYSVSNPFLIYFLMIEKYQMCAFLLVIFAYATIKQKNLLQNSFVMIAAGSMTSSIAIGFFCGDNLKLKDRIINYFKLAINLAITLIILGRISVLTSGIEMISKTMGKFSVKTGIENRIYACIDLIASCFIAKDYSIIKNTFYWSSIAQKINLFGVLILIALIISFILCYKDKFAQICGYWILISFFILVVLRWSIHESPLFSLYFSWAIISLLVMGIEKICVSSEMLKKIIFSSSIIVMLCINVPHMISMIRFLILRYPIK